MSANAIKPWVEVGSLHPDVFSPNFSEDIFSLDNGPLADGNSGLEMPDWHFKVGPSRRPQTDRLSNR